MIEKNCKFKKMLERDLIEKARVTYSAFCSN